MRTAFSLLVTLVVCLTSTPIFATEQPPADFTLEIGKYLDHHIQMGTIDVTTRNGKKSGFVYFDYNPSEGPFQTVVEKKLGTLEMRPPIGSEDEEYAINIGTYAQLGEYTFTTVSTVFYFHPGEGSDQYFRFERQGNRYLIPEKNRKIIVKPAGGIPYLSHGATAIRITARTQNGTFVLDSRFDKNPFGSLCEPPALREGLGWGVINLPNQFVLPNAVPDFWEDITFEFFWGEISRKLDRDGRPIPSLSLQKTSNGLELTVNEDGILEEAVSLDGTWAPPYALQLLSEGPRRYRVPLTEPARFYRLRPPLETAGQKR